MLKRGRPIGGLIRIEMSRLRIKSGGGRLISTKVKIRIRSESLLSTSEIRICNGEILVAEARRQVSSAAYKTKERERVRPQPIRKPLGSQGTSTNTGKVH